MKDVSTAPHGEEWQFPLATPTPSRSSSSGWSRRGSTRKDLKALIGSRTKIAEVLSGKRGLSMGMSRPSPGVKRWPKN